MKDSPLLTAYALGDLDDEQRAEVERALEASPELRDEVEAIRRLARKLAEALAAEPLPTSGKSAIEARSPRRWRLMAGLAVAASLLLLVGSFAVSTVEGPPKISLGDPISGETRGRRTELGQGTVLRENRPAQSASELRDGPVTAAPDEIRVRQLSPSTVAPQTRRLEGIVSRPLDASDAALEGRKDIAEKRNADSERGKAPRPGKRAEVDHSSESYDTFAENPFHRPAEDPLSTFSIDVDTASYANVRRFLAQENRLPPRAAVRIEELVNYFPYDYSAPEGEAPFAVHLEVAACPWAPEHRLARIALKGREIDPERRPPSNLVFLVDVSGSMQPENKLPLVKAGLRMLASRLREGDRVAIVTYAGNSGVALPSTGAENKSTILEAIDALQAGGSTNGASGIELAYALASGHFIKNGTNRVILCTDGDFNVGVTDRGELTRLIQAKAQSGVFLSVLGFGMGNLKDNTLETLADKGNGVYGYIDTPREAQKVLVDELSGTLVTIAKDVKLQVEFNPAQVAAYRLLGYENRVLAHQDFNDDRKDAGDVGAGHTVTAFYEIIPVGGEAPVPGVDPLKYQRPESAQPEIEGPEASQELLTVKLRYKEPEGATSKLLEQPLTDSGRALAEASNDFRFAAAVAQFGLLLRDSPHRGKASLESVASEAEATLGADPGGLRQEFLQLVGRAKAASGDR